MKLYTTKINTSEDKSFICDDMILTKDIPTSAGSKMLDGYISLFEAEVLTRAKASGYTLAGKCAVGEFAFDTLGESSFGGAIYKDKKLVLAAAQIISSGDVNTAICLDANGSVRRGAAQSGLVSIKPTYGTVSRFGAVPVACSGDTVSILGKTADNCAQMLSIIQGHDDKDGTSLPQSQCDLAKIPTAPKKIAVLRSMNKGINEDVQSKIDTFCKVMSDCGIEICEIEDDVIFKSKIAWNILMSAELCNNVSKYDGVKYGYRAENFSGIDELYTNSRTEAFGDLLKTAILFGSETLSTENYMKVYDKSLRTRRVIAEAFASIFESFDAVIMPACSKMEYSEELVSENKYLCYEENFYTAPASITGLPAVVVGGVQLVGKAFSDTTLLNIANLYEKEGK